MHTIGKNQDNTWWTGRMEQHDGVTMISVMFNHMPLNIAARLCNFLNGGADFNIELCKEFAI